MTDAAPRPACYQYPHSTDVDALEEAFDQANKRLCFGGCTTRQVFEAGWDARGASETSAPAMSETADISDEPRDQFVEAMARFACAWADQNPDASLGGDGGNFLWMECAETLIRPLLEMWSRAIKPRAEEEAKPVAKITGMDEYGPCLGWFEHWSGFSVGTKLYAHPPAQPHRAEVEAFQQGVDHWMDACFDDTIKADQIERADRFIEEGLELVQTVHGFNASRAHALVDYVFARDVGEREQEVGGVMVTLAALCNTAGISITECAERELARVWTKIEAIRAKQAAKPTGSALPIADAPAQPAERALVECIAALLPSNLNLDHPGWDDSTIVPVDFTLGELRAAKALMTRARQTESSRP